MQSWGSFRYRRGNLASGSTGLVPVVAAGIATDLIGWWKFDEGSGTTVADASGNGNNGTLSGSTIPTWTSGSVGNALNFNGSSAFVDLGNASLLNPSSTYTMTAWVNPSALTSASDNQWILARDDNTLGRSFAFGSQDDGSIVLQLNGNNKLNGNPGSIVTSTWAFVCVTSNGASATVAFLNGTQVQTGVWGAQGASTGHTTIGKRTYSGFNDWWTGKIQDVRIYNTVLSGARISTLNANGAGGSGNV